MARGLLAAVILALGVSASDRVEACGDKYLNLGLGTRYQRSAADRRVAAVLVYASDGSPLFRAMVALSVDAAMKKAGYQPVIVTTPTAFDAALRARPWDVLVVDGADRVAVSRRLAEPAGPHVVPVLTGLPKDEVKQARRQYGAVIDTPSKSRVFVDAVDDALDLHEMELGAAAKSKGRPR